MNRGRKGYSEVWEICLQSVFLDILQTNLLGKQWEVKLENNVKIRPG